MALDDNYDQMAGGPSGMFNPAWAGVLLNPDKHDMFMQHMAANGVQPPADFDPDFDHHDARELLGAKLQGRAPGMGEASGIPQQGSFEERFSDAMRGPPGSATPYVGTRTFNSETSMPLPEMPEMPQSPGPEAVYDAPGDVKRPGRFPGWLFTGGKPESTANIDYSPNPPQRQRPFGGRDPDADLPKTATPTADSPSTTGGSARPAGTTREEPGDLSTPDPTAKAASSTEEKKEAKGKDNSWDTFGKALAGISAIKPPTPVFPHPGYIPHPSNQISRSQYPTELLKELSHIGLPANTVRLGALLKGR